MPLIVHHLQVSQSERVVWLCEELGLEYELKTYKRAPLLAPSEFKALHPAGTAPIIQDGDLTLAESAACIEWICRKHANGKLFIDSSSPAYVDFVYWWHWANSSFQATISRGMATRAAKLGDDHQQVQMFNSRFKGALKAMNERLRDNEWLAGSDFSVADVMLVFSLTTMRYFYPYNLGEYGNILKYLARVGERKAYQKAMEKGDPGMELVLGPDPPKKPLL